MPKEFTKIAELSELREGKGSVHRFEDDEIALVKLEGGVYAFMNICPHQHTPLVDKYGGQISGENLMCPMHGWTYHVKTGKCINESGKLKMLEVKVEDGAVFVRRGIKS
ncbi:MAG: Rieske (2Fe-2S) protein [Bacteroidetes bacterium]|nr:Rieske (2Fe-2S) protein [Bacteroidota bacterium]